jgi:hypothetical protein
MPSVCTIRLGHNYTTRFFPTTCFGLMGPSSGMLGFYTITFLLVATLPHTGQVYVC